MPKMVFFIGAAGAGKTTAAMALVRRRPAAFLDMDTLLRPAAEAIMKVAGLDPDDRDSPAYKELCRDLGYRITMNAAAENVRLGMDAYLIGPFTQETADPDWLERELAALGEAAAGVEVKVVYVYLENEEKYRERIRGRELATDEWKLRHWEQFSRSLTRRDVRWNLPEGSVLRFDNSGEWNEEKTNVLERFVYGESKI